MLSCHGSSPGPPQLTCQGAFCWPWVEDEDGASLRVPIQKLASALLHCPPWQKNRWELKGKQDVVFSFSWCCFVIRSLSCPLIASLIVCLPSWWIGFSFHWFSLQDKLYWADPLDILYLLRLSVCMMSFLCCHICVHSFHPEKIFSIPAESEVLFKGFYLSCWEVQTWFGMKFWFAFRISINSNEVSNSSCSLVRESKDFLDWVSWKRNITREKEGFQNCSSFFVSFCWFYLPRYFMAFSRS